MLTAVTGIAEKNQINVTGHFPGLTRQYFTAAVFYRLNAQQTVW